MYIVEPPNKGHIEDSINSPVLSFIRDYIYRMSCSREVVLFLEVFNELESNIWDLEQCPL